MRDISLIDQFGRIHDYLRISLTERCNLRCSYCMPEEGIELRNKSHFMSTEEVIKLAEIFVELGVKKIRLTGGEPLVRKDISEIILGLSKLPVEIAISTNGVLVDKYIDLFNEAKIKSVNVSLDSLHPDKFKSISRRDEFHKVKKNIDLLIHSNFRVKVNAVIIKNSNDDEIVEFIKWTKDHTVQIRFIEFMPFSGNNWNWNKGLSNDIILANISDYFTPLPILKLETKSNETAKCYKIDGFKGSFGFISTVSNPFCADCNRIRLTADGKVKNCLFASNEMDLLSPLRTGADVKSIIKECIWQKKAERGGMDSFKSLSNPEQHTRNRSMVAIGG